MIRNKKTTGIIGGLTIGTILGFLFATKKARKNKLSLLKDKEQKRTTEEQDSFYDSLPNLLLMNESLFRSNSI